jgi:superfamily II DNA or RNA helicase
MLDLWPHQQRGIDAVQAAIAGGYRRICLTSPTGGGKSRTMAELIGRWTDERLKVALYTNRKLLIQQTSRVLDEHGIPHGVRAADWNDEGAGLPVQICSLQTEENRVFKSERWRLHDADRVIVDEAHNQTGKVARKVFGCHHQEGASIVGFTATPIGIGDLYDTLIAAGTQSELRQCGPPPALLPVMHYAPDEPDLRKIKGRREGEDLSERENDAAMRRPGLFGRVWANCERLNPEHKPTIVFGPSVAGSLWLAEQFTIKGVRAAHIDGEQIWFDGQMIPNSQQARADLLAQSADGRLPVICNRFVCREGIDMPHLTHCILACVFGSLQSYLQAGGRVLRYFAGLDFVTVQDHGGNWWRHGSLGADREWRLNDTNSIIAARRADRLRGYNGPREKEPMRCPVCALVLIAGRCQGCSWIAPPGFPRSRPVVTVEGELTEMPGEIYRPRRICRAAGGVEAWIKMYWRSRMPNGLRTFHQAFALFAKENDWAWPDRMWPFMPLNPDDCFRLVKDVPRDRLILPAEGFPA